MSPEREPRATGTVSMTLPFELASAFRARHQLQQWLSDFGAAQDCVDAARVVVTELVGNAVRHADPLDSGGMVVSWREEAGLLELAVSDGGSHTLPLRRAAPPDAVDGRGLNLVDALARRWWIEQGRRTKTVHAELSLGGLVGAAAD